MAGSIVNQNEDFQIELPIDAGDVGQLVSIVASKTSGGDLGFDTLLSL